MQEQRWKNQYIDLVAAKPAYIVAGRSNSLSPEQIAQVRRVCGDFDGVFCELCSGSGGHLVELAQAHPNQLYVGFELRFKRAFNTAKKAERLALQNLLVLRTTAFLLPEVFTERSLSGVYVNFPDPWEKERWKKNRVLNPKFLDAIASRLRREGFLSYKSDHQEYFESTVKMLEVHPLFSITSCVRDLHASELGPSSIKTEFEKLFISKGLPIHFLQAEIIR